MPVVHYGFAFNPDTYGALPQSGLNDWLSRHRNERNRGCCESVKLSNDESLEFECSERDVGLVKAMIEALSGDR
ncbi:hypothetical protein CBM2634_P70001 [Cupriavidus taiwanensis]|uniref:Uncharacterized protein n=1 Tax=Cupriavidus taiwanensis TaxID=164546 RepID=A0A375JAY3_9BURK|nr:hypothetical protein CBM2634_P70001 [Cupriavidus taiwanensis]